MNANPDIATATITTTTTTPEAEPAPAPAPAEPDWECSVCYGDGRRTARLTLSCTHPLCLGCFTGITQAQPQWNHNNLRCPMCRTEIRQTTNPSPQQEEQFKRMADQTRQIRNHVATMRINLAIMETRLTAELDALRRATADFDGAYETYEAWTHPRPEYAHLRQNAPIQGADADAIRQQEAQIAQIDRVHAGAGQAPIPNALEIRQRMDAADAAAARRMGAAAAPTPAPAPAAQPNNAIHSHCPGCRRGNTTTQLRTMGDGRRLRRCLQCQQDSRRTAQAHDARQN